MYTEKYLLYSVQYWEQAIANAMRVGEDNVTYLQIYRKGCLAYVIIKWTRVRVYHKYASRQGTDIAI